MKSIYKLRINCGRMGRVEGVFVADSDDVEQLLKEKKTVYFGEILGKHSEVVVTFNDPKEIVQVTSDPQFIELFEEFELSSGYNPFEYLDENEF